MECSQALVKEINRLWDEPDYATGHAYVVFNLEVDRNAFLQRMHSERAQKGPAAVEQLLPRSAGNRNPTRWQHTHGGNGVEAMEAPEPSEVLWQNLELDDAHETKVERRGWAAIVATLCLGLSLTLLVRRYKVSQRS